jgi:hypothetical protein
MRKALLAAWAGLLMLASGIIAAEWHMRVIDAKALGFTGLFERYRANIAGFDGPENYRTAERERRQQQAQQQADQARQQAEQARLARARKEVEDRAKAPRYACYAAQETVKKRLSNPGTARFPSCLDYPGHVTPISPTEWLVLSWVELPDASGIYRQHGYQASVKEGAETYQVFILSMR